MKVTTMLQVLRATSVCCKRKRTLWMQTNMPCVVYDCMPRTVRAFGYAHRALTKRCAPPVRAAAGRCGQVFSFFLISLSLACRCRRSISGVFAFTIAAFSLALVLGANE